MVLTLRMIWVDDSATSSSSCSHHVKVGKSQPESQKGLASLSSPLVVLFFPSVLKLSKHTALSWPHCIKEQFQAGSFTSLRMLHERHYE